MNKFGVAVALTSSLVVSVACATLLTKEYLIKNASDYVETSEHVLENMTLQQLKAPMGHWPESNFEYDSMAVEVIKGHLLITYRIKPYGTDLPYQQHECWMADYVHWTSVIELDSESCDLRSCFKQEFFDHINDCFGANEKLYR
jgi:hypothetical protein